jgi:release factor glutamine methyltransferase
MNATVHERIAEAREALMRAGLRPTDAATDASVLARHALGWDRATLVTRGREAPPPWFDRSFEEFVARRAAREPVALIMGTREFWGLDFDVTADVLVPRPETELIVEEALAEFANAPRTVIDIGTGTGCLAIALAREFPASRIIATDISGAALQVAARNARRHAVSHRIAFVRTSFLEGVRTSADLIVSNPPYVPESDAPRLTPEVVRHEPSIALFGGRDGLAAIRQILATVGRHLAAHGRLIVEFGLGQETDVIALAEGSGWRVLRVREDLQGIPRTMVLGRQP